MEHASPYLSQVLTVAGWFPGRRVSPEPFVTSRAKGGRLVHDKAREFFAEFGGLSLDWSTSGPFGPLRKLLNLGEPLAGDEPLPTFVKDLERREGPLVRLFCGTQLLSFAMAPSGRVYAFFEDPMFEDFIWGPWPSGVAALDAYVSWYLTRDVTRKRWPVYFGEGDGPNLKGQELVWPPRPAALDSPIDSWD